MRRLSVLILLCVACASQQTVSDNVEAEKPLPYKSEKERQFYESLERPENLANDKEYVSQLLDKINCSLTQESLPNFVKMWINKMLHESRVAGPKEFTAETITTFGETEAAKELCPIVKLDLNGDAIDDYVVRLLNKAGNQFSFNAFFGKKDGTFRHEILSQSAVSNDGKVCRLLKQKAKGKAGLSSRKWFFSGDEAKLLAEKALASEYENMVAVETSYPGDQGCGKFEGGDFYCDEAYYFPKGKLKKIRVCD